MLELASHAVGASPFLMEVVALLGFVVFVQQFAVQFLVSMSKGTFEAEFADTQFPVPAYLCLEFSLEIAFRN